MSLWIWLALAGAGAVGAPVRYLLDGAVGDRVAGLFPWGTFVINQTGAFLLGLLTGLVLYHGFPGTPKLVLGTGFLGAYTTFSTFSFETVALGQQAESRLALLNLAGSMVAGAAAAAAGLALAAL